MSISLPKTSISILDAQIKLLTIPRAHLRSQMYAVTRCLAFRHVLSAQRGSDPFFNLTLNSVELSIFADAELIDKVFTEELEKQKRRAQVASTSSLTSLDDSDVQIEISDTTWIALQVEQHDGGDESEGGESSSGSRVRDISAPLAAEGISILFLSTYISDFLLIKQHRLELVIEILQRESFYSHEPNDSHSLSNNQNTSTSRSTSLSSSDGLPTGSTSNTSSFPHSDLGRYGDEESYSPYRNRHYTSDHAGSNPSTGSSSVGSSQEDSPNQSRSNSLQGSTNPSYSQSSNSQVSALTRSLTGSVLLSDRDTRKAHSSPSSIGERLRKQGSATDSPQGSLSPLPNPLPAGESYGGSVGSPAANLPQLEKLNFSSSGLPHVTSPTELKPTHQSLNLDAPTGMESSVLSDATDRSQKSGIETYLTMNQDKIALLPDELVVIGLSLSDNSSKVWKAKILHALFYCGDVLPLPERKSDEECFLEDQEDDGLADEEEEVDAEDHGGLSASQVSSRFVNYGTTPTPDRPLIPQISPPDTRTSGSARQSRKDQPQPGSAATQRTYSNSSNFSADPPSLSGGAGGSSKLTSTKDADYPTPFLSLTLTVEGGSLIADIRLLRALFEEEKEAETMVYASGQGGLFGLWEGEDDDFEDEDEDEEGDVPEYGSSDRGRRRNDALQTPMEDEDDLFSDSEDWQKVRRQKLERRNSGYGGDNDTSGRKLFKCLQLDLTNFDLEKAGLVHQFAGLLTDQNINLLYSSTFRTANILVAKGNIRKARLALESAAR